MIFCVLRWTWSFVFIFVFVLVCISVLCFCAATDFSANKDFLGVWQQGEARWRHSATRISQCLQYTHKDTV